MLARELLRYWMTVVGSRSFVRERWIKVLPTTPLPSANGEYRLKAALGSKGTESGSRLEQMLARELPRYWMTVVGSQLIYDRHG